MKKFMCILLVFAASPVMGKEGGPRPVRSAAAEIALWEVPGDYAAVRESIEFAITNKGLVVDHVQHIGEMLERTGRDIGASRKVYGQAHAHQFCSSTDSRAMMEADPGNIAFCPFIIFTYTLEKQPGKVYVGYRKLPTVGTEQSKAALKRVQQLLDDIIKEALSW